MRYDREDIARLVACHESDDDSWRLWFETQGIEPLRVSYEALAEDPVGVVADILRELGVDPKLAKGLEPRTARLADARSQRWYDRFKSHAD